MISGHVVIVGSGHAGVALAVALRAQGFDGELTLVGDEAGLPYHRPPLSKAYLGEGSSDGALFLRPVAFFTEQHVGRIEADRAVAIDRAARTVTLASGRRLDYDALVLATGARNRQLCVPGADAAGVHYLRTMAEARALRARLPGLTRAVVIGAGFIGLEFAATAARAGAAVAVVDAAPRALARSTSPEIAARLAGYHESLGTTFRFGATVEAIETVDGHAYGVRLAGERLAAEVVVVGIGVVPNDELAAQCGLAIDDGIVVDRQMATSDPAVFAIGDCAAQPSTFGSRALTRLESVQNANDTARLLAAVLSGAPLPSPPVPWFWSDQGEAKLQIAGLGAPDDAKVSVGGAGLDLTVLRYKDGALACVETLNRPGDHMAARRIIGTERAPSLAAARAGTVDLRAAAKGR